MSIRSIQNLLSNGVGTGELLPEHDDESDEETLAVARSQAFLPGHALGCVELLFDRSSDLRHLVDDLGGVHRLASNVSQRCHGLVVATLLAKPSGTLLQEEKSDEHNATEHELDRHWDSPLLCARGDVQSTTVV